MDIKSNRGGAGDVTTGQQGAFKMEANEGRRVQISCRGPDEVYMFLALRAVMASRGEVTQR